MSIKPRKGEFARDHQRLRLKLALIYGLLILLFITLIILLS